MEHEDEKLIRVKVLVAEEQAVRWNRDDVWNKLHQHQPAPVRRVAPYYVAAGISLLAAVIVYTQWRAQQDVIALKIKTLENSIAAHNRSVMQERLDVIAADICAPAEKSSDPQAGVDKKYPTAKAAVTAKGTDHPDLIEEIDEPYLAIIVPENVPEQSVVSEEESTTKKRTVVSIVIAAPEKAPGETPKIAKHKKFHLFRSPDRGSDPGNNKNETDILVARIN